MYASGWTLTQHLNVLAATRKECEKVAHTCFYKQLVAMWHGTSNILFLRLWPNGHWCMCHYVHANPLKELQCCFPTTFFKRTERPQREYIHCSGKQSYLVWMWKHAASVNSTPTIPNRQPSCMQRLLKVWKHKKFSRWHYCFLSFLRVSHGPFRLQSSPNWIEISTFDRNWLSDTGTVKPWHHELQYNEILCIAKYLTFYNFFSIEHLFFLL